MGTPAGPVTPGHIASVTWMASDEFREIHEAYESVAGPGGVYFRPTDDGIKVIALLDEAPAYVGVRSKRGVKDHTLSEYLRAPSREDIERIWAGFLEYLPTICRKSTEERGVIRFIREALRDGLRLPKMGGDWLFLNQEWRWGVRAKSDVLAVHGPTGRLGIIEFKSSGEGEAVRRAIEEAKEYAGYWVQDSEALAPFFTEVLRVNASLYGNREAETASVSTEDAALFYGIARPGYLEVQEFRQ